MANAAVIRLFLASNIHVFFDIHSLRERNKGTPDNFREESQLSMCMYLISQRQQV